MKLMKAALPLSTGALLMSVFHQLLGGNNGSGWGRSPPRIGWAAAGNAEANIVTMVGRDVRNFTVSITISDGSNNHYPKRSEPGMAGGRVLGSFQERYCTHAPRRLDCADQTPHPRHFPRSEPQRLRGRTRRRAFFRSER